MTYDIEGWVETCNVGLSEEVWVGAICIPSIVDCYDSFSEQFFGLSKAAAGDEKKALAGARGVPIDASSEVRADLLWIAEHEAKHGCGEFGGYTYATWKEVDGFLPRMKTPPDLDWVTLLAAAATLAKDPRFTAEGVRFVVWYNW